MNSKSTYAAQARYDAANTKHYGVKLNLKTDADLVSALDAVDNKQAYIKNALRAYAEGSRAEAPKEEKKKKLRARTTLHRTYHDPGFSRRRFENVELEDIDVNITPDAVHAWAHEAWLKTIDLAEGVVTTIITEFCTPGGDPVAVVETTVFGDGEPSRHEIITWEEET